MSLKERIKLEELEGYSLLCSKNGFTKTEQDKNSELDDAGIDQVDEFKEQE